MPADPCRSESDFMKPIKSSLLMFMVLSGIKKSVSNHLFFLIVYLLWKGVVNGNFKLQMYFWTMVKRVEI